MTADEIIERLKAGNARFTSDSLEHKLQDQERRNQLKKGQEPPTIVLSCADSRVVPELAFDAGLGELFIIRVAGNIANASSIASIEYAVHALGSKVLMVMGHESCGAVTAARDGADLSPSLDHLLAHIKPAVDACGTDADVNVIVKKNAQMVADELCAKSSIIKGAVESGGLKVVSTYYDFDGNVNFL